MKECSKQPDNSCQDCPAWTECMRKIQVGTVWQDAVTAGERVCKNFRPETKYEINDEGVQQVRLNGTVVFNKSKR